MEIAVMQQTQPLPDVFKVSQNEQNHSDNDDLNSFPYLLTVKKSHSTPHNSLSEKFNLVSDRAQQQKENELQEIKEQEKLDAQNDDHGCIRNKEESIQYNMRHGQDHEMRKFSTAASEELKVDFPHYHSKSNSSSLCNLSVTIEPSGQRNDQSKTDANTNIQRQEESKKIQTQYLEQSEKNKLFEDKIRKNIKEFALDKYSHFILILVLESGSAGHKRIIIESILKEKDYFSHEQFGHKVLNKCIEVSKKEFVDLYTDFIKYILDNNSKTYQSLQNDKFGNYVIQKCLETFDDDHLTQLLLLLNTTLLIKPEQKLATLPTEKQSKDNDLCSDQYGCLIIQKLIEIYKIKPEGKIKKQVGQMIEKVINDSYRLAKRQFSNYVVQQIIEKGAPEHKNLLYQNVISKQFINLSMDKYGSNVAEKAVKNADSEQKKLIWNLISTNNFNSLFSMVNDQFANYVAQRIFDISNQKEQKQIYTQLNDWNRKNKLKENGKHPFKYIEDVIKQNDSSMQNHNQYRGNQNRVMNQNNNGNNNNNNNNNSSNNQGNRQQNYYNKGQNNGYNNQQGGYYNQNNQQDQNQNQRQSNYNNSNNNTQGNKNRNDQQNVYFEQRNSNQQANQNNQNRNSGNNSYQKSHNNNQQQQNNQSKHSLSSVDSSNNAPQYQQQQQQDQGQQRNHKNNYNRNQNQQPYQFQSNTYPQNQRHVNHQQKPSIESQPQQQNNNNSYINNNYQGGKRNQQGDQNYQQNHGNRPQKRYNQNRGQYYNNHHSYYNHPQQYYQSPYYHMQQGYYNYPFPYQQIGFIDPAYAQQFDMNQVMGPNILNQTNPPYFDLLNGAHIQVFSKKNKNEEEDKKESQSETTAAQSDSQNSQQTQTDCQKEEKPLEISNKEQVNSENKTE